MRSSSWVVFAFCLYHGQAMASSYDAAAELGATAVNIADAVLGTASFRAHLKEGDKFLRSRLEANAIVKKLADNIDQKLDTREDAVKKLGNVVFRAFEDAEWGKYRECCDYSQYDLSLGYDPRFFGKVDLRSLCTITSSMATRHWELPSNSFLAAALENMEKFPGIKSQYFGSDGGTLVTFPASRTTNCASYDNRFRPWYVKASAPVQKDIVVMIDMSGSMKQENRMRAAKHATTTILETLSPDDRVSLVGFSDMAFAIGSKMSKEAISRKNYGNYEKYASETSCYDSGLVSATPSNIHHLEKLVEKMVPHGDTNYTKGLEIAFDLLYGAFEKEYKDVCRGSGGDATDVAWSRERAIIFLSDGKPSDRPWDILNLIYYRNLKMHNSVVLLSYALGKGTFGNFIHRMSQQSHIPPEEDNILCYESLTELGPCYANGASLCRVPAARKGFYKQVVDSQYLRSAMGSYYNFFATSQGSARDVTWSVPYFDAAGLGMVMTAASPVLVKGRLVGVVGTDVTVSELMSEVTYFHTGGLASYAFLLDGTGRVLLHPYMPSPASMTDDPVLTHVESFERSPKVRRFLEDILQDGEGLSDSVRAAKIYQFAVRTERVIPQEHSSVLTREANLTYTCTKVRHFVICVVIDVDMDTQAKLRTQTKASDFNFLYHRFDLDPPKSVCKYQESVSSGQKSSVFLAPAAFFDVGLHMGQPEPEEWLLLLSVYMNDHETYRMGRTLDEVAAAVNIHAGIRDTVRVTSRLDEIWNSDAVAEGRLGMLVKELKHNVIFRYFSSESGVFRIHPGIQMPKMYNPVHRPWYEQASSYLFNPQTEDCFFTDDKLCHSTATVSPPYIDATGSGAVVTISQAILAPGNEELDFVTPRVVGVMAGDVKLGFIKSLLLGIVKECRDDSATTSECILIDLAGYVIYDNTLGRMNEAGVELMTERNYHITSAHRVIAEELVRQGVLVRRQCVDVSKTAYHEEYKVDFETLEERREHVPFGIHHVNYTNMVLLLMPKNFWVPQYLDQASCIKHDASTEECERKNDEDCESPCMNFEAATRHYDVCTNHFNVTLDHQVPPCVPDKFIDERISIVLESDADSGVEEIDPTELEDCFDSGEYASTDIDYSLFDNVDSTGSDT